MSLSKIGVRRWSLFLSYVGHYSFLSVMQPISGGHKLLSDQTVGQLGRSLAKTAAHTIILSSDSDYYTEKKRGNKTSLVSHPSAQQQQCQCADCVIMLYKVLKKCLTQVIFILHYLDYVSPFLMIVICVFVLEMVRITSSQYFSFFDIISWFNLQNLRLFDKLWF